MNTTAVLVRVLRNPESAHWMQVPDRLSLNETQRSRRSQVSSRSNVRSGESVPTNGRRSDIHPSIDQGLGDRSPCLLSASIDISSELGAFGLCLSWYGSVLNSV